MFIRFSSEWVGVPSVVMLPLNLLRVGIDWNALTVAELLSTKCSFCKAHIDFRHKREFVILMPGEYGAIERHYNLCVPCMQHIQSWVRRNLKQGSDDV